MKARINMKEAVDEFIDGILKENRTLDMTVSGYTQIDKSWGFKDRVMPDHIFYFLTEGGIIIEFDDERIHMKKSSCFWIKPLTKHTFNFDNKFKTAKVYHYRFIVKPELDIRGKSLIFEEAHELKYYFEDAYEKTQYNKINALRLKIIFTNLVIAMSDYYDSYEKDQKKTKLNPVAFKKIREAIENDPTRAWTARDLSQMAALSLDYFTVLFKGTTGVAPKSWLLQQKVKKASLLLLESTETISRCADQLGFTDIYHFSRCFKNHFGLSPKAWRRKFG
jgi:AraC-like DNA-binding protein